MWVTAHFDGILFSWKTVFHGILFSWKTVFHENMVCNHVFIETEEKLTLKCPQNPTLLCSVVVLRPR